MNFTDDKSAATLLILLVRAYLVQRTFRGVDIVFLGRNIRDNTRIERKALGQEETMGHYNGTRAGRNDIALSTPIVPSFPRLFCYNFVMNNQLAQQLIVMFVLIQLSEYARLIASTRNHVRYKSRICVKNSVAIRKK